MRNSDVDNAFGMPFFHCFERQRKSWLTAAPYTASRSELIRIKLFILAAEG